MSEISFQEEPKRYYNNPSDQARGLTKFVMDLLKIDDVALANKIQLGSALFFFLATLFLMFS